MKDYVAWVEGFTKGAGLPPSSDAAARAAWNATEQSSDALRRALEAEQRRGDGLLAELTTKREVFPEESPAQIAHLTECQAAAVEALDEAALLIQEDPSRSIASLLDLPRFKQLAAMLRRNIT